MININEKISRRDINKEKRLISEYKRLSVNRERSLINKVIVIYISRDIAYYNTLCFHSYNSSAVRYSFELKALLI